VKVTWFGQYHWTARITKCNDGAFIYDGTRDGDVTFTTFAIVRMGFANYPKADRELTGPQWDTLIVLLKKLGAYCPLGS
jgi:hypothetical protein